MNIKPLKKTKKLWASLRTRKDVEFPAFLGNLNGTVKADERGNVFVTLFSGDVLTVYNARVPNKPRLPVVIGYEASNQNLLQVLRSRDVYANGASQPDVPDHNHTWGRSTNPTWVRGEQFLPGLVTPNSDVSVHYMGLVYWLDGAFRIVPEQDIDLSANIPASGALFAILEVDDTGVISVLEGSPVDSAGLLTYADIPDPSADKKPLMFAVKLYAGQTVIKQGFSFADSDIVDLRWSGYGAGGAGGGVASVTGDGVDNTNPANPVLSFPTPGDIGAANASHDHDAGDIVSGTLDAARLPKAETFTVKNTSGATANNYDAGYISASGEYKTSTTSRDVVDWCVVVSGGANNADIIVARRGRVTVNYTGTAPSAGHYLSLSTSAGLAQRETEMHPAIFAVCTAAGSGGTVEVQLLCLTVFKPTVRSTDMLRIDGMSSSDFVATINGAPSGSTLTYNNPSSGNENTIKPSSSSEVGNLVLFNTTRGNSALIDSVNTGTNVITLTSPVPAGWANGDTITCRSQTYSSLFYGGAYVYEIDLTGVALSKTRAVGLSVQGHDSGTINGSWLVFIHKLSSSPAFGSGISIIPDWAHIIIPSVEVISNKIMLAVNASGTGTMSYVVIRLNGVWEAVP